MATKTSVQRTADLEALNGAACEWGFVWSEFQSTCEEADRFGCETVQPADAKIRAALSAYVPDPAWPPAAIERDLMAVQCAAVPDYDLIHDAFATLIDEDARLKDLLMQTAAPDLGALLWKIEHLTAAGVASRESRASVAADARRLLAPEA
jgi:hypothetical protein